MGKLAIRMVLAGLAVAFLHGQGLPTGVVGWYNGDWKPAIPGKASWYLSEQQFARVFDDFVVPERGWTIVGAFSHVSMPPTEVTEAVWEIRSGVSEGQGGTVVAAGRGPATVTQTATVGGGNFVYLLQVSGL